MQERRGEKEKACRKDQPTERKETSKGPGFAGHTKRIAKVLGVCCGAAKNAFFLLTMTVLKITLKE